MARNKHPEVTIERILDVSAQLFLTKGYDNTSIQDILNSLGDLSKGAIYHHFKSKEAIAYAVLDRFLGHSEAICNSILAMAGKTAVEKLQILFEASITNSSSDVALRLLPNLLKDPKFLVMQVNSSVNDIAPRLLEPLIREGIEDGSIKTEYPEELAEVLLLVANLWLNPMVFNSSPEKVYRKCMFFKELLEDYGIDVINEEIIEKINLIRTN